MNTTLVKSFVAALFLMAPVLATSSYAANAYPHAISAQEAKVMVDQGTAVLIDVRELAEVQAGMAEPASWYPKSSIDSKTGAFVDYLKAFGDKTLILYCRSGNRVSKVIEAIAPYNVRARNMGAFQDWANAGFPVKKYTSEN